MNRWWQVFYACAFTASAVAVAVYVSDAERTWLGMACILYAVASLAAHEGRTR